MPYFGIVEDKSQIISSFVALFLLFIVLWYKSTGWGTLSLFAGYSIAILAGVAAFLFHREKSKYASALVFGVSHVIILAVLWNMASPSNFDTALNVGDDVMLSTLLFSQSIIHGWQCKSLSSYAMLQVVAIATYMVTLGVDRLFSAFGGQDQFWFILLCFQVHPVLYLRLSTSIRKSARLYPGMTKQAQEYASEVAAMFHYASHEYRNHCFQVQLSLDNLRNKAAKDPNFAVCSGDINTIHRSQLAFLKQFDDVMELNKIEAANILKDHPAIDILSPSLIPRPVNQPVVSEFSLWEDLVYPIIVFGQGHYASSSAVLAPATEFGSHVFSVNQQQPDVVFTCDASEQCRQPLSRYHGACVAAIRAACHALGHAFDITSSGIVGLSFRIEVGTNSVGGSVLVIEIRVPVHDQSTVETGENNTDKSECSELQRKGLGLVLARNILANVDGASFTSSLIPGLGHKNEIRIPIKQVTLKPPVVQVPSHVGPNKLYPATQPQVDIASAASASHHSTSNSEQGNLANRVWANVLYPSQHSNSISSPVDSKSSVTGEVAKPVAMVTDEAMNVARGKSREVISRTKRILLVDDSAVNLKLFSRMIKTWFEREGWELPVMHTASNGAEALDMVTRLAAVGHIYELIFMDRNMPVMDGIAATRMIKRTIGNNSLVIGVTGDDEFHSDTSMQCRDHVDGMVRKGMSLDEIREVILSIVYKGSNSSASDSHFSQQELEEVMHEVESESDAESKTNGGNSPVLEARLRTTGSDEIPSSSPIDTESNDSPPLRTLRRRGNRSRTRSPTAR